MLHIPDHATKVFEGIIFDVYHWEQELFDGTKKTFELARRLGIVVIIPIIDGKICVHRESQPGQTPFLTLPSGYADRGEVDLLQAAQRELLEETGYTSSLWTLYRESFSKGRLIGTDHIYIARDCKKINEPILDKGGEQIHDIFYMTFDEFLLLGGNDEFRTHFIKDDLLRAQTDPVFRGELYKKIFG